MMNHLPALDSLRGVAILLVVIFHTLRLGGDGPFSTTVNFLAENLWIGVDLFFVLSGFLITRILLATRHHAGRWKVFWLRRALRIFPLYYSVLLVLYAYSRIDPSSVFNQLDQGYWPLFTYTFNWWVSLQGAWPETGFVNHFWSLCLEEQYYLVWPFVVFFLRPRSAVRVAIVLVAASALSRGILFVLEVPTPTTFTNSVSRGDGLLVGSLAAMLQAEGRLERWARIARKAVPFLTFLALAFFLSEAWVDRDQLLYFGLTPMNAAFAALILMLSLSDTVQPRAPGAVSRTLQFFGKYSYGIYVYHTILFKVVLFRIVPYRGPFAFVLVLLTATMIAFASYHLLERPFLRVKPTFSEGNPRSSHNRRLPAS